MLTVSNVNKKYKKSYALHNASFQLENGVCGLIGENGAGKSTIMKILTRQITLDSGKIFYQQKEWNEDCKTKVGYLPQEFDFFDNLTLYESLQYLLQIRGMNGNTNKKEIMKWLEYLNLTEQTEKKIKKLSGGMKQRLGIAQAFMGEPEIILLDEPTVGLDPKERLAFRNMVNEVSKDNIILISTHILDDVESACERIITLKSGKVVYEGRITAFIEKVEKDIFTVSIPRENLAKIGEEISIISIRRDEEWLHIRYMENDMKQCQYPDIFKDKVKVDTNLEDAYFYNTDLLLKR